MLSQSSAPAARAAGIRIDGLEDIRDPDVKVFHAGTRRGDSGEILTAGGRVLGVTALGEDRASARRKAYDGLSRIRFDGLSRRTDIALEDR